MKNLGGGRHQLIIKNAQLSDEGDYICKSDKVETKGHLTVHKGESKPKIKFEGPVTGKKTPQFTLSTSSRYGIIVHVWKVLVYRRYSCIHTCSCVSRTVDLGNIVHHVYTILITACNVH